MPRSSIQALDLVSPRPRGLISWDLVPLLVLHLLLDSPSTETAVLQQWSQLAWPVSALFDALRCSTDVETWSIILLKEFKLIRLSDSDECTPSAEKRRYRHCSGIGPPRDQSTWQEDGLSPCTCSFRSAATQGRDSLCRLQFCTAYCSCKSICTQEICGVSATATREACSVASFAVPSLDPIHRLVGARGSLSVSNVQDAKESTLL